MSYVWTVILTSTFWIFGYIAVDMYRNRNAKGKPFKYEVGELVNVYAIQGFTALSTATIMDRKRGIFGRPVYRVRMGREQRWQGERGMFLIDNKHLYNTEIYRGNKKLETYATR